MKIYFTKYQGAGNDFVIIDVRQNPVELTREQVALLCDRRFGVGADGLMTLGKPTVAGADFDMRYWNSDGGESTMCGNGGRCIAHFADTLGLSRANSLIFNAVDGIHSAGILAPDLVRLRMIDTTRPTLLEGGDYSINTGSPHIVRFVPDVAAIDIRAVAPPLRALHNANINFVQILAPARLAIRTFERGVEDETLACGTGATAAAITAYFSGDYASTEICLRTLGGELKVGFQVVKNDVKEVFLTGPAKKVFTGELEILS